MKKLIYILPFLLLVSCAKFTIYSETYKGFADNRWEKSDARTFEFEVTEVADSAKIDIKFSHIYEPGYNNVPLEVKIKKPSGEEEVFTANLILKDAEGNELTDCLGDICDLEQTVKEGYSLTKGKYAITLSNTVQTPYLPNVIGVGISVKTAE